MSDRPPGTGPSGASAVGPNALTMQQRTVLERLITRLVTLTSQQNAEVWACVKHDLGLKGDTPLLASHFSAAESNLNQRFKYRSAKPPPSANSRPAQRTADSGK